MHHNFVCFVDPNISVYKLTFRVLKQGSHHGASSSSVPTPCCHSLPLVPGLLSFGYKIIVHTCAWHSYPMSWAHIIWPKWQRGVGTLELLAVWGVTQHICSATPKNNLSSKPVWYVRNDLWLYIMIYKLQLILYTLKFNLKIFLVHTKKICSISKYKI